MKILPSYFRFAVVALSLALALLAGLTPVRATTNQAGDKAGQPTAAFRVPVEYYKLPNNLKVVLSPDSTAPIVTVAVYYNIGFRIEPRDRTGFAHLFEHMIP